MKKPKFCISASILLCLSLATSLAFAQKPERKKFGIGHPFQVEELPTGKLKNQLETLNPQAKEKALRWLHTMQFEDFDAADHLRVDKDGGIFFKCPDSHGACDGHTHESHEEQAAVAEKADTEPSKNTEVPTIAAAAVPITAPPAYNSKPGATRHIYLDFNGALVSGKAWSETYVDPNTQVSTTWTSWDCDAWSSDTDKTTFIDSEQAEIRRIWERISEDYAPFDVNVTTDVTYDPVNYTGNKNNVGWLLFTPTTDKLGARCPHYGSGGVAYVGVYGNNNYFSTYQPAWVTTTSAANMAEAASHEMGHNMGLSHDGTTAPAEYYSGHAATATSPSWGPIMGTGYNRDVSQWSKGEYYNASQTQNDLSIINGRVPYRTDDYGDTFATASVLLEASINQKGIVETTGNPDFFAFTTAAGTISFNANAYKCDSATWGSNLDITLELYNSSQTLIASSNPAADVNASISQTVAAGEYFIAIKPSGAATPLATPPSGYTSYGSLGQYTLTGSIIPADTISLSSPNGGESWTTGSTQTITWASGMGGNVKIELLKNGVLNTTIAATTLNDSSFSWTIPSTQTLGSDYRIKITSIETPAISDLSLTNFSIIILPTLADALDTSGLSWTTSGNLPWFPQFTTSHDNIDAAQSGAIADSQTSSMETTVTGPGTMTFWWSVSSEADFDYLRFYINNTEQIGSLTRISGTVDWVQKTVTLPAGTQTVKWSYTKDGSVVSGSDAAWVDEIIYTPSTGPEIAVEQPLGINLTDGSSTIDFGSVNLGSSSAPLTFTIKNNGTANLTGLALTKNGTHSANYTLGSLGASSLAPGASTTFAVTFTPSVAGTRTAAIQIASNDADENPFDISLTGIGAPLGTLAVTPAEGLTATGNFSGPFSPDQQEYTLTNQGSTTINWTATKTANWINLSATSGSLSAGASTTVTATINTASYSLAAGFYSTNVNFTNTTNNNGNTARNVSLDINALPLAQAGSDQTIALNGQSSWTPASISVLAWYDAKDPTTITHNSGPVSQWNDKSGNNRHITQATLANQPTYANNTISFDGVTDHLWNSSPFLYANGQVDVFIIGSVVATKDSKIVTEASSASNAPVYGIAQTNNSDGSKMGVYIRANGNSQVINHAPVSATAAFDTTTKLYHWRDTSTSVSGRVNAGSEITAAYTRSGTLTLNRFGVGALVRTNVTNHVQASINEIVLSNNLSPADREKMEGYLAHKWNQATSLPSNHPYRNISPGSASAVANLDGTASDADSDPITTTWTLVSGPGLISIANPNAIDTTATFTTAGTYVLRLTVSDGFSQTTDDVVITVRTPTPYDSWTSTNNLVGGNALLTADLDNDGLNNLLEFAFGTNPQISGGGSTTYVADGAVTNPGSPTILSITAAQGIEYSAVYARRKNHLAAGLTYRVHFSADLINWTTSNATPTVLTGAGNPADVEAVAVPYPATVPVQNGSQKPTFFRVTVSMP